MVNPATTATEPNRRHRRPTDEPAKRALSVAETCAALGISRPTLYKLIGDGKLRTVMLGGRRVIPVGELDRLLADND